MTVSETKVDFLGETIGLDDLIKRIEEIARTETSLSDPWFIGECVYSCGNLPLTKPFKTFGDFVSAFSNRHQLTSVTNSSGGLRFSFTDDADRIDFYVGAVSEDIACEYMRVAAKYEKYTRGDFYSSDSLWDRYMKELYAPLENATHLGYHGWPYGPASRLS